MPNKKRNKWRNIPGASSFGDPCSALGFTRPCSTLGIDMSGVHGRRLPAGDNIHYATDPKPTQQKPGKLEKRIEVLPIPEEIHVPIPRNGPKNLAVGSFYDSETDRQIDKAIQEELGPKYDSPEYQN